MLFKHVAEPFYCDIHTPLSQCTNMLQVYYFDNNFCKIMQKILHLGLRYEQVSYILELNPKYALPTYLATYSDACFI